MFLHMICRLSVAKSHENGLGLEQLDPLSADLAAWPIAPEDRTRGKREGRWIRDGCIADWWISFGRRRSARPEHRAHASGMDGVRSVFAGLTPEEGTDGKRPDDQHTAHAATRFALAFALARTGYGPWDSATCHQAGEQSLLQQTLSCTRGAPTVAARMTPRRRQTDGEARQRKASEGETDRPQRETAPKMGEQSLWEGDRPQGEAHSPANRSGPSNASQKPVPVAQTPGGDSRSIDREFARTPV